MKTIFEIECIYSNKEREVTNSDISRSRTWCFYFKEEAALETITKNITDIYENNYYNYVILKEKPEGITSHHKIKEWVFRVNYKNGEFKNITWIPKFFDKTHSIHEQVTITKKMSAIL